MRRLDDGAVFAECEQCRYGFLGRDLADGFATNDLEWERTQATKEEARAAGWGSLAERGVLPAVTRVPEPSVVAAWFVLDRVPLERVPWWAAEWLVQGYDGDRLRELAGEHGDDVYKIKDLLPEVLVETQAQLPNSAVQAGGFALDYVAALCVAGRLDERETAGMVTEIVAAADFAVEMYDYPLGGVFGLDDEWDSGWGRSDGVIRAEVREACAAQLARGE